MKVLQIHNFYQMAGGEATVVKNEKKLLEDNGHEVITYYKQNKEVEEYSLFQKASLIKQTTWSQTSLDKIVDLLKKEKPSVCHVHNFLPLISLLHVELPW